MLSRTAVKHAFGMTREPEPRATCGGAFLWFLGTGYFAAAKFRHDKRQVSLNGKCSLEAAGRALAQISETR
jgi:hypothetical protein